MSANDPELIAIDPMDDKKGLFVGDGVQKSDYQPWFNTNMLGLLIVGLALIWSITRLVRTKPPSKKGRVEQKIAT